MLHRPRSTGWLIAGALAAPESAFAHAGGLEVAPLFGAVAGFAAGLIVGALPRHWRKWAVAVLATCFFAPIVNLVVSEPGLPGALFSALATWLSLGLAFYLVPAALSGYAGYMLARRVGEGFRLWRGRSIKPSLELMDRSEERTF